jgi:hypothetical protein
MVQSVGRGRGADRAPVPNETMPRWHSGLVTDVLIAEFGELSEHDLDSAESLVRSSR